MSENQTTRLKLPSGAQGGDTSMNSMRVLLDSNLGREVVADFVTAGDKQIEKAGVLSAVGLDYLALYDDVNLRDIVCDLKALKFITFYLPGSRPGLNGNKETQTQPKTETPSVQNAPETRQTPADEPINVRGVTPVTMAALNYAKRKTRK